MPNRGAEAATLNGMQLRTQLALMLVLVMALAPLAGTACGIQCLAAVPQLPMHAAAAQQHCVRTVACCHSTAPAVCSVAQAPEAIAALLSSSNATADISVFAVLLTEPLPQSSIRATNRVDSAPPGPPDGSSPIPLRI